jgi:DNA-binding CsgD family transcriptional regulator/type II secretory pathway predicted ATPase ExeA
MEQGLRDHITTEPAVRHQELLRAVEAISHGSSVLLVGAVGIGKSFLAQSIVSALPRASFTPVWVRASSGRSQLNWSAVCASLGVAMTDEQDTRPVEVRLDERLAELAETAQTTPVLAVDDALHLDLSSAEWIGRVARESSAVVLACVEFGPRSTDEKRAAVAQVFRSLWTDGISERLDLARLDERTTLKLTAAFGGDSPLDLATQQYIAQHTSGVPLLIRELVLDARDRLPSEADQPSERPRGEPSRYPQQSPSAAPYTAIGPRTFDLSRGRIDTLTAAQLEAMVNLAQLGTIPQRRASQLVGGDRLAVLMRRGHVVHDLASPDLTYVLATDADSAAALGGPAGMTPTVIHMIDAMVEDHASGLQMTPLEAMFVAGHWDDASVPEQNDYLERFGAGLMAQVYVLGAAQSNASGHTYDALAFSRHAEKLEPSVPASIEMAKALASMGRNSSARSALARVDHQKATREDDLLWYRWATRLHNLQSLHRLDDFLAYSANRYPSDPTFAAESLLAGTVSFTESEEPVPTLRSVVDDERIDTITRIRACGYLALNAAYGGQLDDIERASSALLELEQAEMDDAYSDLLLRETTVIAFTEVSAAQIMTHVNLDQLTIDIDARMATAIKHKNYGHVVHLSAACGVLAVATGDFLRAEREMRVTHDRYSGTDPLGWRAWAGCQHAAVLAILGRLEEAERRMGEVRHVGDPHIAWYAYAYETAAMEISKAQGRFDEARARALLLVEQSPWSPLMQVQQLFAAASLGEPAANVAPVAERIAGSATVPALLAMAAFLQAKLHEDGDAAYAVGEQFLELQMRDAAKLAFDFAARRFGVAGDKRRSKESLGRASDLASAMIGQRATPVKALELSSLSAREGEIVQLIAMGKTNREIAQELYLSVRTVESHVYRLLRKLDLTNRRELVSGMLMIG